MCAPSTSPQPHIARMRSNAVKPAPGIRPAGLARHFIQGGPQDSTGCPQAGGRTNSAETLGLICDRIARKTPACGKFAGGHFTTAYARTPLEGCVHADGPGAADGPWPLTDDLGLVAAAPSRAGASPIGILGGGCAPARLGALAALERNRLAFYRAFYRAAAEARFFMSAL